MQTLKTDVVIIGGGASGIAALAGMLRNGFKNVILLEKSSGIGGIWYTTKYPNLRLHSQSYSYKFIDFHPPNSKTNRATREELLAYMNEYASEKKLYPHIKLNTTVAKIVYHKDFLKQKCEVYAIDNVSLEEIKITCSIVVCALGFTAAGNPHIPHFKGEEHFAGTIVHSSLFTQEMLNDILVNHKKLVVLGAGKSSQEILSLFQGKDIKNIIWLYTKSLWSFNFEKFFGKHSATWFSYFSYVKKIRQKFTHFNWLLYLLERPMVWGGLMINPIETHSDVFRNRMAIMPKDQYKFLKKISKIHGSIQEVTSDSLNLSNGKQLKADYLVCATGYEKGTNLPKIMIYNHDKLINEHYDPRLQFSLFRSMIDPNIPEIAFFTTDIIYPQLLFAFSLAAEWLAKFYLNKLTRQYSLLEIAHDIEKNNKIKYKWSSQDEYLSKGSNYNLTANYPIDLVQIFEDMGIEKQLAVSLFFDIGIREKFEALSNNIYEILWPQGNYRIKAQAKSKKLPHPH